MKEHHFDFLHASEFVSLGADVWREAIDALPAGPRDVWTDVATIGEHIHKNYKYTPLSTNVNTRAAEVIRKKQGVCQDFAHIMLSVLRTAGLPARYVCGYIETDGPGKLVGSLATHAWVEVMLPGLQWAAIDPTNNQWCGERHIAVTLGRDFVDASPVRGTFKGSGTQSMKVRVTMKRLAEKP